jgi:hypothetical protein
MRYCPVCQRTYANHELRFCLHDGAELTVLSAASNDPEATLLAPKFPSTPAPVAPLSAPPQPLSSSGAGWKVAVAALGLVIVALLGVVGWALFLRDGATPGGVAVNGGGSDTKLPTPARPTPTATPRPTPDEATLPPDERAAVEDEVRATLDAWLDALRAHDFDTFMAHYANRLEIYYTKRDAPLALVSDDKARAFEKFYELDGKISGLRIEATPSGRRATATFQKSYYFKGDEKDFSGSVRSQMTFVKSGGAWLIVGERDL